MAVFLFLITGGYFLLGKKAPKTDAGYQSPQIFIYGGDNSFSAGGLISLASTDEPAVQIGGYNISGNATVEVYKANPDMLLDYLTHDKDGKQTKTKPDVSKLEFVGTTSHSINTNSYEGSKVSLPLAESGVWYLKVKIGNVNADAFVLRSGYGILAKEGDNEFIFWGQDFKTKRSINAGSLSVLNMQDTKKSLSQTNFDSEGLAKAPITEEADIAFAQINDQIAIVPLNLKYLNTPSYKSYLQKAQNTNYFVFTDRPLYKPGDKVYFKAILRNDDDARYTIPSGSAKVKISSGYGPEEIKYEKTYPISSEGTVVGEYQLSADAKVGGYSLEISTGGSNENISWSESHWWNGSVYFDVEYFQKPQYFIEVTSPKTELIAGDKSTFKIQASYFSGQPLAGQKVKYRVAAGDYYDYQYYSDINYLRSSLSNDYKYSYYGSHTVLEGVTELDKNGQKEITFDTKMDFNNGRSQVFAIEATLDDNSQTPSFSRQNVLVYAGQYGIYRSDYSYGGKVNTDLSIPLQLYAYEPDANIAGVQLTAKVHWETWESYNDPNQKYPQYKKVEQDLSEIKGTTDSKGNVKLNFKPQKVGFYTFKIQGTDEKGNTIGNTFYAYVSDQDQPAYTPQGGNELTVSTDREQYSPGDTVKLSIYSKTSDRDVFLAMERGRVNRFQIVHLNGNKGSIDLPILDTDIPNMYAKVSAFSSNALDGSSVNLKVSTLSKRVVVGLKFDSKKYAPGDTVNVQVTTKDGFGNPVSSDVALWAVDKAIFELSDSKLGNIFNTFWNERGDTTQEDHSLEGIVAYSAEGGGCFLSGTKILMSDGKEKNIEDVKVGDYVLTYTSDSSKKLVKAKVLATQKAVDPGYLIINGNLKVTPDHIIMANGVWREAGSVQFGDELLSSNGDKVKVYSIEWQRGKVDVYNLTVDKYHTYFANGLYVHNQKGDSRSTFKDTAYWNPSVKTNSSGLATVSFKLPDNLTTWTVAAVADTADTKVGQTTEEIIVTKDVIVRPILPNIIRLGDTLVVSALVQNSTDSDKNFDVDLKFDSGDVTTTSFKNVKIATNSIERFAWEIKPQKENPNAKLEVTAQVSDNEKISDGVISEIPVIPFGYFVTTSEAGDGNKDYNIAIPQNVSKEKSKLTLSLSPTVLGTLPTAMKYLVNYPYGCTEQITSRFVPALIAKANPTLFADALKDKDIDEIIQKGIARLVATQNGDGGWTWWFTGTSDPYISSYVAEYLVYAQKLGYKVDKNSLDRARGYLGSKSYYDYKQQKEIAYTDDEKAIKNYGLVILGNTKDIHTVNVESLSLDTLALNVITNSSLGNKNPASNGLNRLTSMAQTQGDSVYWEAGSKLHFGSKDASTAFAIRAIIASNGDRELAVKASKYLIRNRKFEYWSNTFATAQVVRAVTDLSKTGGESNPNFLYSVTLDDKELANGQVQNIKDKLQDIDIDTSKINSKGSNLKVTIEGQGQLYSAFVSKLFYTDTKADAVKNGLSIKREYINEKGDQYQLAVGDSVIVKITATGPKAPENYAVITDELPSGMVPVNPMFKNEQYGENPLPAYFSNSYVTGMDVTQNGAVLSLYLLEPGTHTFTYRARVVSAGKFTVPPAEISLMYDPAVNARTEVQTLTIAEESKLIPTAFIQVIFKKYFWNIILGVFGVSALIAIIVKMKGSGFKLSELKSKLLKIFKKNKDITPPITPDVQ